MIYLILRQNAGRNIFFKKYLNPRPPSRADFRSEKKSPLKIFKPKPGFYARLQKLPDFPKRGQNKKRIYGKLQKSRF